MFPRRVWEEMLHSRGFEAEPRGWLFDEVGPRYGVRVSVSEVTTPCRTGRDVYLRRVAGIRSPENTALTVGRLVHEAFMLPFRLRAGYGEAVEALREKLRELNVDDDAAGVYERVLEEGYLRYRVALEEGLPVEAEPAIPGDALGLGTVRPDLLVGYTPVEVVVAGNGGTWWWRKQLALAGYAMAVEAWTRSPVDYGVVVGVRIQGGGVGFEWRLVRIDSRLRRRFLDRRDMIASIIASREDPGVADGCPRSCPFWGVCHGQAGSG